MIDNLKCPRCGSNRIWKVGKKPRGGKPVQRYQCGYCGREGYQETFVATQRNIL